MGGNVLDMAGRFVQVAAFARLVTPFASDIVMPLRAAGVKTTDVIMIRTTIHFWGWRLPTPYWAAVTLSGLSRLKVSTDSAGTLMAPPLVRT